MIETLSEVHQERYRAFRDFVAEHVEPDAGEWDREGRIPRELLRYIGERGYFGAMIPAAYGGMGWDNISYGLLNEAFGRGSSSLTVLFTVQNMVAAPLMKWGTREQVARWLPGMAAGDTLAAFALTEPGVGSEIGAIKTAFTRKGSRLVLNGTKRYITFGGGADIFLVFGQLEGKAVACIVERDMPGVQVRPIEGMLGFRACQLAELEFGEVELPEDHMIGKPGFGVSHVAPVGLHCGRLSTAFSSVGLIRACLETGIMRAKERTVSGGTVDRFGQIRSIIAEMGVDYDRSLALCLHAAVLQDQGSVKAVERTIAAKLAASRSAVAAASNVVQVCGAYGCHEGSSPAGRYYRDAKIMEIIEGTSQVLEDVLCTYYTNQYNAAGKVRSRGSAVKV